MTEKKTERKLLEVQNVTKHFGGVRALDHCTFALKEKKITALIGPNGSGKTTLFHVVGGMIPCDSGGVRFRGRNITRMRDYETARQGIARTFQEVRLFRNLTIAQHLEIALQAHNESLLQSLITRKQDEDKERAKRMHDVLALVGLQKSVSTLAMHLSYGQRKLLDIAMALARTHVLLLLDEPVAGVNPAVRQQIKQLLRMLKKRGETIALIEHDMNFVMDIADEVIVLDEGKVIAQGKPRTIQNNKKVLEAYLGG